MTFVMSDCDNVVYRKKKQLNRDKSVWILYLAYGSN